MIKAQKYSAYLAKRSLLGLIYRKLILYPALCKYLDGVVLDVGCGIGDLLEFRRGAIGVDVNSFNVKICKQKGLNAQIMEPDYLPFSDQIFDSILLDNVLEHIERPGKLIDEIRRVLRPSGSLLVGVPGIKGYLSDRDHKVFYDEKGLADLAVKHGFTVHKLFYMPLLKSSWLSERLRQYCIYTVWIKNPLA